MVLNYRRDKAEMRKLVKTIALVAAISAIYGGVQNTYTAYANETESGTAEETTAVIPEETTKNPENNSKIPKESIISKISPSKSKTVVLDPGHCSVHTGAKANGLREEKVVLDIANACRDELNKYENINVYMTRDTGRCCSALKLGDCLVARNNYALRLDADFLVSMHINADDNPYRNGAMILPAYRSGCNDNVRIETQALGRQVLANLKDLGIKNLGLLLRKADDMYYGNGARADYYSIVRNGVKTKIPSIIIEHGFVTSKSDCEKFFSTKAKREMSGVADANAIVSYYGLNPIQNKGKFVKENGATYYVTEDGKKVKGWVKHNSKWYYFSKNNGKMRKGFISVDKKKYYLSGSNGALRTGWIKVKGYRYLTKGDGSVIRNQAYSDGVKTYLFSKTGKKYTKGRHRIKGKMYYINKRTGTVINR